MDQPEEDSVYGAAAEVIADFDTGKVVTRFLHPETGGIVMELHLDPEIAREFAYNQTRASIAIEEHQKRQ